MRSRVVSSPLLVASHLFLVLTYFVSTPGALRAADADTKNFYSPNFRIDTGEMSPITYGRAAGVTEAGQQDIILFLLRELSGMLLILMPVLAVISVVVAGYLYLFSLGDTDASSRARTILKYNVMALVVAILSYSIILFISQSLR